MSSLRQIPLHVLLLAGLAASASSQETSPKSAAPKAPAPKADAPSPKVAMQPYVGVNVLPLSPRFRENDLVAELPEGIGIVVGFVDPKGPAADVLQEKDVLTRLDDQVLVNPEQFRALVRTRQPGQAVKLVRVRGAEVETVSATLAGRPSSQPIASVNRQEAGLDPSIPGGARITVNGQEIDISQMIGGGTVTFGAPGGPGGVGGQVIIVGPGGNATHTLPPEVRNQLEAMRQRGLPVPEIREDGLDVAPDAPGTSTRRMTTFSRSFSLGFGGPTSTSSTTLSDEQGTVHLRKEGDKKFATVKDAAGQVQFEGEVTSPDQLKAVPEVARNRIGMAEGLAVPAESAPTRVPATEGKSPAPAKPSKPIDPRKGA
jgi:hypothetical protein